jgi:hypothetical protein
MNTDVYKKRTGLNSREVDTETVIIDRETGEVHQLNATASYIWDSLDGETAIQVICESFAKDFNIPGDQSEKDVAEVIKQFKSLNLIE